MAERPCPQAKTMWRSLIIQDLDDAIVVLDDQRRVVDLNPSALRLAGADDARPFLGEPLDRLFPALGDVPCPPDEGESIRRELTMEGEAGLRHLVLRVTPLYEARHCLGCLLTLRDVTEQKRVEAELRASKARYRTLVENAQVGVFSIGADYRFIYVNDEMSRILGVPRDQLIGRDFRDFIGEEVRAIAERHYLDRRAGRPVPAAYEVAVRAADGVTRRVEVRIGAVTNPDGSIQSVGQCLDVTRYREIEEELQRHRQYLEQLVEERTWELIHLNVQLAESEERLRALVNATPDIVGFKDGAGRWLLINEAGLHVLRLDGIDYRGKRSAELALLDDFHHRIFAADEAADMETWRAGTVTRRDMRIPAPDGTVRIYDIIRVPIFYPDGRRRGIVVIGRDITARVQAEEEVQRHRRHLEEALRRRNLELETLTTIITAITSTLSLEQVLQRIVNATYEFFPGLYSATIQLLEEDGKLHMRAAAGRTPSSDMALVFGLGEGIAGRALQEQRLIYVPDVSREPHFVPGSIRPTPYRSMMSAPLIAQEQRLGTLSITAVAEDAFTPEDKAALLTLASYAAIAVQNARLYEQVQRDAETKTMLLQEVNHRVKNNLATIIGLLYAERRHVSAQGEAYRVVLDELITRIQGLATVHSMLSASAWGPLLLSDLVAQVIRPPLGMQAANKRVEVKVTPSPVRVNSRQAGVLALVFNELVTNVIKYVLPVQEETQIAVTIEQEGDARVRCEFRDNGPGYPDDVLKRGRANVGLYLVKTLVARDLNGELEMYNDGGAVVVMRFAVE